MDDYDYSHLMEQILNQDDKPTENLLDHSSILTPSTKLGEMPEAEKVLHEIPEAPTYSGDVFGRVKFLCKLSLAVNEVAVVQIPSRLQRSTISSK